MSIERALRIMDAYRYSEGEDEELQEQVRELYPKIRDLVNKLQEADIL